MGSSGSRVSERLLHSLLRLAVDALIAIDSISPASISIDNHLFDPLPSDRVTETDRLMVSWSPCEPGYPA